MGTDASDRGGGDGDPNTDVAREAVDALAHARRRRALYRLREAGDASLDELAAAIAAREPADERNVRIRLHHWHLPMLADAGLAAYDAAERRARPTDLPPQLSALLDDLAALDGGAGGDRTVSADGERPRSAAPDRGAGVLPERITSLPETVRAVERDAPTITAYAPEPHRDLLSRFAARNVSVEHEHLPVSPTDGLVVVTDDRGVVGSTTLSTLADADGAAIGEPWTDGRDRAPYREFLALFRETPFGTDDRGDLLATSREFEDRAWRTARGSLHAGFQSLSTFRPQVPVYERLADRSGLDVVAYGRPDWTPDVEAASVRPTRADEIASTWFVAFADETGRDSCALLAEERAPDEYVGFWTYDAEFVDGLVEYLEETYG